MYGNKKQDTPLTGKILGEIGQAVKESEYRDLSKEIKALQENNIKIAAMTEMISEQIQVIIEELDYINRDRFDNMRDEYL